MKRVFESRCDRSLEDLKLSLPELAALRRQ